MILPLDITIFIPRGVENPDRWAFFSFKDMAGKFGDDTNYEVYHIQQEPDAGLDE
jgi:hypothetical protein